MPQQLYNLLEDGYRTFHSVSRSQEDITIFGFIPNGLKINKKAGLIGFGNASKNYFTIWNLELAMAEVQLMKIFNVD